MIKTLICVVLIFSPTVVSATHTFDQAYTSGLYRGNTNHVLSLPYQRVRRAEDSLQSFGLKIYDDGFVRVQDNTQRNATSYQKNRSVTGVANIVNARSIPSNERKTKYTSRYPHTRYTNTSYRRQTTISLPNETYCDWVTYFDKYHDGIGWVDYERIVPECEKADGYILYLAKDPVRAGRFTPSSYNQFDSYRWSDGVQEFQSYGW